MTSNQFLKAEYGRKLRGLIHGKLYRNLDFSNVTVFEGLATYVSILNFTSKNVDELEYSRIKETPFDFSRLKFHKFNYADFNSDAWNFNLNKKLKDKLYNNSILLGECADFVYGIITGNDASFILTHEMANKYKIEKDMLFDFVKPENYIKYAIKYLDKYIIYPYDENNQIYNEDSFKIKYPKAYEYLLTHKSMLENRKDSRTTIKESGMHWYTIMRKITANVIKSKKIIFYDVGGIPNFCLDDVGLAFGGGTSHSLTTIDTINIGLEYLLALLNSKLLTWIIMDICPVKMGGARKYGLDYMRKLPIKRIDNSKQLPLATLATKRRELTSNLLNLGA